MPSIIYAANMSFIPIEVEINKNNGYFNVHSYDFMSFYNSDYLASRAKYLPTENSKLSKTNLSDHLTELYELFRSNSHIHILRATDQALKCRWHLIDNCDKPKQSVEESKRCFRQREYGLGTKAQLAMHLMKSYDTIGKK